MKKNKLIQELYRVKVRKGDVKEVADLLGISYFTLRGKLNGFGNFTEPQLEKLKEYFEHSETPE